MQNALLKTETPVVAPVRRGRPPLIRAVGLSQKDLVEVAKAGAATTVVTSGKMQPNPIDVHVGSRIRMRRTMLGMSQERLGDAVGITFQQIQKYEKGTNRVGASRLQAISTSLKVPVSFFFEGAPNGEAVADMVPDTTSATESTLVEFLTTPEGLQLNRSFAKIADAKVRRKVVELVKAMAAEADSE